MKLLICILLLIQTVAFAQEQCAQMEFSGEATQTAKYAHQLLPSLALSVNPRHLKEDPRRAWFEISVTPDDRDGIFVFTLGDRNWLLHVSDFWSVFIGGANSDLGRALQYRSRYFVFPITAEEKGAGRKAASVISSADDGKQLSRAITALESLHLAHLEFEITDYGLGGAEVPRSVEWVKFDVKVTFPPNIDLSTEMTSVPCPSIPPGLLENIRNPKRHSYVLAAGNPTTQ